MQLQSKHQKIGIIEVCGKKIAARRRLSALAALLIALIYLMSAVWRPDPATAQGATETQLGVVLSANQEVPPVTAPSTAKGVGTVTVSADQTTINYTFTLTRPLTGAPQQAHIHVGPTGVAGPVMFFLCNSDPAAPANVPDCPPAAGGEISGTLTAAALIPRPEAGIATFADAVAALNRGDAYANFHTPANPSGEIRGQIGPVGLGGILSSVAEIPPVTTPSQATGTLTVALLPDRSGMDYTLTLTGPFTGAPQQAHIHVGPTGATGPVVFFLCSSAADAPAGVPTCPLAAGGEISGMLTAAEFMPRPEVGIMTFDDAIDALISGGTYANVHTPANASGEIRGQLVPLEPALDVSFALDIQPIFNANCSCHISGMSGGLSLAEGQSYANLVGVPSSQVPSLNRVEPGDPDNSYLYMKHSGAPGISGGRMPLNNPTFFDANPDLLELERQWILGGALNN
jgi:hypothetical protein